MMSISKADINPKLLFLFSRPNGGWFLFFSRQATTLWAILLSLREKVFFVLSRRLLSDVTAHDKLNCGKV